MNRPANAPARTIAERTRSYAIAAAAAGTLALGCAGSQSDARTQVDHQVPTRTASMAATQPTPQPTSQPSATTPHEQAARAPMSALWTHGPNLDETSSPLHIELSIERVPAFSTPIRVSTVLPEGVSIAEGPSQLEIPADVNDTVLRWTLTFEGIPSEDFVVQVDARGEGFGFHAEPRIRFGRPEPSGMNLQRTDEEMEYNGLPLGRPIDMSGQGGTFGASPSGAQNGAQNGAQDDSVEPNLGADTPGTLAP